MIRILTLAFLFGQTLICAGQTENKIPKYRQNQLDTLIKLIKHDGITGLADKIRYPIKRPNPIPDIETREQFILYYPILFDSTFKKKLTSKIFDSSNTIDRDEGFGLSNGDLWLDHAGRIMAVNYSSAQELELLRLLHQETENKIHTTVQNWKRNILVCQSDEFLIRIDLLEDNQLRYISWSKTKNISEKPDLVLFNGKRDFQGTMGGVTYTFEDGDWTYTIDRVQLAESEDQLGLYLRVYQNDQLSVNLKIEEIK